VSGAPSAWARWPGRGSRRAGSTPRKEMRRTGSPCHWPRASVSSAVTDGWAAAAGPASWPQPRIDQGRTKRRAMAARAPHRPRFIKALFHEAGFVFTRFVLTRFALEIISLSKRLGNTLHWPACRRISRAGARKASCTLILHCRWVCPGGSPYTNEESSPAQHHPECWTGAEEADAPVEVPDASA